MEEKKLTDEIVDLLTEFDEYGFQATVTMPNAEEHAKDWKNRLIDLFHRLQDETAKQKAEIERLTEFEQRYLEESKERCKIEHLYEKIRHDHNIGLGVQRKHWEKKVQQAVKDTAKKCYELFKFYKKHYYDIPLDLVARDIKEKTGVEVE